MSKNGGNAASAFHIQCNGSLFHCRIDGNEGAPWLVFSNSLATNLSLWDEQVTVFAKNFRILRYDQRGHGQSGTGVDACTFDLLVDDIVAILDALGIARMTFAGVSMGAVTGLRLASRFPERVARLIMSDGQWASPQSALSVWDERIEIASKGGMDALVSQTVARWFTPGFAATPSSAVEKISEMIRTTPLEGFIACARALQNYDFRMAWRSSTVPCLLIAGAEDGLLPNVMQQMQQENANAIYAGIPDAGHLPNFEKPDIFNQILNAFLKEETLS